MLNLSYHIKYLSYICSHATHRHKRDTHIRPCAHKAHRTDKAAQLELMGNDVHNLRQRRTHHRRHTREVQGWRNMADCSRYAAPVDIQSRRHRQRGQHREHHNNISRRPARNGSQGLSPNIMCLQSGTDAWSNRSCSATKTVNL